MNAIVTVSIGDKYLPISNLTHPTIKAYAKRIGAEFVILDKQIISKTTPQWEKFRIFNLLNRYNRIIYLDSDLIIRDDCPNLFNEVTEDKFGVFDESLFVSRAGLVKSMLDYYGKNIEYNNKYYNTGVMVLSRKHKFLFDKPVEEVNNFYEQTYLNMCFIEDKVEIHNLDYRFNRMSCIDNYNGISRLDSYIIHYAGCPTIQLILSLIEKDLSNWKKDSPKYIYKQKIIISVSGGLGDQIDAQPAIRFMRKKVLPNAELIVVSHYPRLFRDIENIKVFEQGKFIREEDTAYKVMDSFPPPSSSTYFTVGNLLCHTVDYCSIALLKRTLPFIDKNIELSVSLKDIQRVIEIVGIEDLRKLVLIHPGKHWETKTMPYEWWDKIIDKLIEEKIPVCLIGKKGDNPGVWDFEDKKGVINTVDLLDLSMIITLISQAKILVSNDSAPIHIAGAFDNWIMAMPTVKHPDHIFPFRKGSVYYKTDALYKKLVLDDYATSPTEINEVVIAKMVDVWDKYLISPEEVVEIVKKRYF